jgi:hypothetical protein
MNAEVIEITDMNKLPRRFEAYTDMDISSIVKSFKAKYDIEPVTIYRIKIGKVNLLAVEITDESAQLRDMR